MSAPFEHAGRTCCLGDEHHLPGIPADDNDVRLERCVFERCVRGRFQRLVSMRNAGDFLALQVLELDHRADQPFEFALLRLRQRHAVCERTHRAVEVIFRRRVEGVTF